MDGMHEFARYLIPVLLWMMCLRLLGQFVFFLYTHMLSSRDFWSGGISMCKAGLEG